MNLIANEKTHAILRTETADAYLKAGTEITIQETRLHTSGNLWAKIPSGWLCIWEKNIDKTFVK